MSSLICTNLQHQQQQGPQMSAADAIQQTMMTQCYSSGQVAAAPPAPVPTPTTLPPHILFVPPGSHYYELNGNCYFLNLASGEKVELGPVEPMPTLMPPTPPGPLPLALLWIWIPM